MPPSFLFRGCMILNAVRKFLSQPYSAGRETRKDAPMTFPEDHLREKGRVEDHSALSIVVVSVVMIVAAIGSLSFVVA